jgi:hypothetical protein
VRIEAAADTTFDLFCGLDFANSLADTTNSDLEVADIVGIFAYTMTDCLYACANSIHFQSVWGDEMPGCKAVTWQTQMAASNTSNAANCVSPSLNWTKYVLHSAFSRSAGGSEQC